MESQITAASRHLARIARELFEDLVAHVVSKSLLGRVHSRQEIVTTNGEIYGKKRVRRNDSFSGKPPAGELDIRAVSGFDMPEGIIAEPQERISEVQDAFDEVLVLPFRATNDAPAFPFSWVDEAKTRRDYGAVLTRIGSLYDERFG